MARWLALIAVTQQISCAGGGGTSVSNNVDPIPPVVVTISPSSSQISAGGTVQFLVTVQNASNPAVTWAVNGIAGGNSSVGTIASSGAATASYAAPASVSSAVTVTVTAALQADPTAAGSATVAVNPLPTTQVSLSPANPSVATGASQQFTATVQNGPQNVIWEVNGAELGNSTIGFINSTGFYTAPTQIPTPAVVTIAAVLTTDLSIAGSTSVTIIAPAASLSVSPGTANLATGQTLKLSASVQNSNLPVIWQVNGPGADSGTIVSTGTHAASYTAPSNPTTPTPFTVTVTATLQTTPPISATAGVTIVSGSTFTGVYSWRNDDSLTGQNAQETHLTPSTVSPGTFGKLFGCAVDGVIFAQPLYVASVATPAQGTHNVVYVATENDSVYAFDADNIACQILWRVSFTDPANAVSAVPAADIPGQIDIVPLIGITGTPVIDPATATLYVVSKTKINQGATPSYKQELHALDLSTGAEKFSGPVVIQATVAGTGDGTESGQISFGSLSLTENQRSALLLAGGNVYVAFDSYGDTDPFHGWLFAYNAGNLQAAPVVFFITTPNGSHGGIGGSGAAPSADPSGNIFAATSDGTFDASKDYAETLLKMQINADAFALADSFTPSNELILNVSHHYFGSTGVVLLPDAAGSSAHPQLAIAGDQGGDLYLLDRNNLASDGALQMLPLNGPLFGTPAYWAGNNTVYAAAAADNLRALSLANGTVSQPSCTSPSLCSTDAFATNGASPVISWDGTNIGSGIVWALDTSGYPTSAPAILHAYDAANLADKLYVSPSSAGGPALPAGAAVKFAVPTVANGKVYVGTQGELSVFGLLP